MIKIKMRLPKNCRVCPFLSSDVFGYDCALKSVASGSIGENGKGWAELHQTPVTERHENCPLLPGIIKKKGGKNANKTRSPQDAKTPSV